MTPTRRVCQACALLALLTLSTGCRRSEAPAASQGSAAATPPAAPAEVQTARAEERQIPTVVRATGTFIADETSDVTPQVAGTVVETLANVGDFVKGGAVIVRLDDRDARIRLSQARAALQQAEAEAQRAKLEQQRNEDLAKSGDISRSSYDRLTAQVAIAEATVAQVKAQLAAADKAVDDTVVRAPFSGHVSARPAAVGEYVTTSVKLLTLVRIEPIKLNLQVPESDAARLRIGMRVEVAVPAHEGAVFMGTVGALNVAIDPNSRSMTVEARFPNTGAKLTPGMFGSAQVRLPATEPGIFVPASAVTRIANGESSAVYVIEGDKVRVRVVQPGDEVSGMRRILFGLTAGTAVATTGLDRLFDGAVVRVGAAGAAGAPLASGAPSHAQAR